MTSRLQGGLAESVTRRFGEVEWRNTLHYSALRAGSVGSADLLHRSWPEALTAVPIDDYVRRKQIKLGRSLDGRSQYTLISISGLSYGVLSTGRARAHAKSNLCACYGARLHQVPSFARSAKPSSLSC